MRKFLSRLFLILILVLIATLSGIHLGKGWIFWKYNTGNAVSSVAVSSDGNYMVAGTKNGDLFLLNIQGTLIWTKSLGNEVVGVSISGDGNHILVGVHEYSTGEPDIFLFDKNGSTVWQKDLIDSGEPCGVSISQDGNYIATGDNGYKVRFFNSSGDQMWAKELNNRATSVSVSSAGDYVAAGSWDHNVYFFNQSGDQLWSYDTQYSVYGVSIAPEGEYVASIGIGIFFFDGSGRQLWNMTSYFGDGISVSAEGSYIVTGECDGIITLLNKAGGRLWNWDIGSDVNSVAITGDGKSVVGGTDDGYVYFLENLLPSTITCERSKGQIFLGESITISGSLNPPHGGVEVALTYTRPNNTIIQRNVTTNGDGYYADMFIPDHAGLWKVKSFWGGDVDNMGTMSSTAKFIASTTTQIALKIGENKTLSECFEPSRSYSKPIGGDIIHSESIDKSDYISFKTESITPTFGGILHDVLDEVNITYTVGVPKIAPEGSYTVNATYTFEKNSLFGSPTTLFTYEIRLSIEASTPKTPTNISCEVAPTPVAVGGRTTISGVITPVCGGVQVTLNYTRPDAMTTTSTMMTNANGTYTEAFVPDSVGIWRVKASWDGDENHMGAEIPRLFEVVKATSSIFCSPSPKQIVLGGLIDIQGSLTPPLNGVNIALIYTKPNDITFTRTTTTASDGTFEDTASPDMVGSWSVLASWTGNEKYETCEYLTLFAVVEPTRPIIDFLLRPDVLGVLLAVVSLTGAGLARFMGLRKRGRVKRFLDEIDDIYSRFKMNAHRCEAELARLRQESLDMLKRSKIDESNYKLLKDRIDEYLQEVRKEIEREGSSP